MPGLLFAILSDMEKRIVVTLKVLGSILLLAALGCSIAYFVISGLAMLHGHANVNLFGLYAIAIAFAIPGAVMWAVAWGIED